MDKERLFNFLKDDLEKLEKDIKENNKENIENLERTMNERDGIKRQIAAFKSELQECENKKYNTINNDEKIEPNNLNEKNDIIKLHSQSAFSKFTGSNSFAYVIFTSILFICFCANSI